MVLQLPGLGGLFENRITEDTPLVTKNFSDFLLGFKHAVLYAGITQEATPKYILSTQNLGGGILGSGTTTTEQASFVQTIDQDFEIDVTFPRIIRGTFYARVNSRISTQAFVYIIIKVRHWDGTTETTLLTLTSETFDSASDIDRDMSGSIASTTFNPGDKIRITIEIWVKSKDGVARDGRVTLSDSPMYVPFVITN